MADIPDLTPQLVRTMFALHALHFDDDQIARLTPLVARQLEIMRELQALELQDTDPRGMAYMRDLRLPA